MPGPSSSFYGSGSAVVSTPTGEYALTRGNNLSDVLSASTSRANLGLAAVAATGSASDITTGTLPAAQLPTPGTGTLGGFKANLGQTNKWVASLNTDGTVTLSQPAFSNLSGSVVAAQMPALTGAVTTSAGSVVTSLAAGAAVANIGYTPANKAGDTFTGNVYATALTAQQASGCAHISYLTGAGADSKTWDIYANSSSISCRAVNDAYNASNVAWKVNRGSGYTVSSVETVAPLTVDAGASFGSQTGSTVSDLSKHIALYSTTHGFNVTSSTLNYVVPAANIHSWIINGTSYANLSNTQFTLGTSITMSLASGGIDMGSTASSNTPYIDFHSSGNANDYDVRLIASGGSASVGQGSLTFTGASFAYTAGAYLNWGSTFGSSGYGLRDNSGALEVKNSGGSWIPLLEKTRVYAAALSGSSVNVTGIPAWATKITLLFLNTSLNGSSHVEVRIGPSGGVEATGYNSSTSTVVTGGVSSGTVADSTGFPIYLGAAANTFSGAMYIENYGDGVSWIENHNGGYSNAASSVNGGGWKTVASQLTQLTIKSVNGTDTFDAGYVAVYYE